jgi:hypothetical protein
MAITAPSSYLKIQQLNGTNITCRANRMIDLKSYPVTVTFSQNSAFYQHSSKQSRTDVRLGHLA